MTPLQKEILRVVQPGLSTTIQDLGRFGYRRYGVPTSGALDIVSHVWTNKLVGNESGAPTIEVLWGGFSAEVLVDSVLAVTGAEAEVTVDESTADVGRPIEVSRGSMLSIGQVIRGHVNYIAVPGGFAGDAVLGSASTFPTGGFGGLGGRPLAPGSVLTRGSARNSDSRASESATLDFGRQGFRTLRGPHTQTLSETASEMLFSGSFQISTESDRVGYRLSADPRLTFRGEYRDLVSFAVNPGMIQVPSSGNPILLMADCQTTGGYPVVGSVVQPDLSLAAQKEPMEELVFEEIDQDAALSATSEFLDFVWGPK